MLTEQPLPAIEIRSAETVPETAIRVSQGDIINATAAVPGPVEVQVAREPGATAISPSEIARAIPATPSELSVQPPFIQAAGVGLARFVLGLIAAAIFGVFFCLIIIEANNLTAYNSITQQLLNYSTTTGDADALRKRLAGVIAVFRNARDQATPTTSKDELALVGDLLQDLRASKRVSEQQSAELDVCAAQLHSPVSGAASSTTDHQKPIDSCIHILMSIDPSVIGQGLNIEQLRIMRDIGKDALDARQGVRTFWLSIAQLVLLNLLLPILTALLGYIFGTQQERR